MTVLPRVEGARERMDAPDVDPRHLEDSLRHIAGVNRWLGGTRSLLRHLPLVLPPGRDRVLDVGTGSGDLPRAAAAWGRDRGRRLRITAVDLHPATLEAARRATTAGAGTPSIRLARADGLHLPFPDGAFDLALLSMTLHHVEGDAQVRLLRELARVAAGGRILVGELQRAVPNWLGARLLAATLWRRNPVTRHDGPLSVRRAFTPAELLDLARRAHLGAPTVHRHFFYRLVLRAEA